MSTSVGVVHLISALTGPSADRLNQNSVSIKQATEEYLGELADHMARGGGGLQRPCCPFEKCRDPGLPCTEMLRPPETDCQ
jgi:hypothetical protein